MVLMHPALEGTGPSNLPDINTFYRPNTSIVQRSEFRQDLPPNNLVTAIALFA